MTTTTEKLAQALEIVDRLRATCDSIRRKPTPLSDYIKLLHQAADSLEALAAHEAEQQAGEAVPVAWLVIDSTGQPMHAAGWEAAAHEHINDAINEYGLHEAADWRVVPVYTRPRQPLSDAQLRLALTGSPIGHITDTVRGIAIDVQNALLGITKEPKT